MQKTFNIEKIDISFLEVTTGIAKNLLHYVFEAGDKFKIKEKNYEIIHIVEEEEEDKKFICYVW